MLYLNNKIKKNKNLIIFLFIYIIIIIIGIFIVYNSVFFGINDINKLIIQNSELKINLYNIYLQKSIEKYKSIGNTISFLGILLLSNEIKKYNIKINQKYIEN